MEKKTKVGVGTGVLAAAALTAALVIQALPPPCITTMPTLWERATFTPSLRPGAKEGLIAAHVYPLDKGALRMSTPDSDGKSCVEVLDGDGWVWRRYEPNRDLGSALKFSRIGPGWSAGHTSGDAFDFAAQYEEVSGHPMPGGYEGQLWVDYEYNASMRQAIKNQWCALPGKDVELACGGGGPVPTATPNPTAVPTPAPTASPTPAPRQCLTVPVRLLDADCATLHGNLDTKPLGTLNWLADRKAKNHRCVEQDGAVRSGSILVAPGVLSSGALSVEVCW